MTPTRPSSCSTALARSPTTCGIGSRHTSTRVARASSAPCRPALLPRDHANGPPTPSLRRGPLARTAAPLTGEHEPIEQVLLSVAGTRAALQNRPVRGRAVPDRPALSKTRSYRGVRWRELAWRAQHRPRRNPRRVHRERTQRARHGRLSRRRTRPGESYLALARKGQWLAGSWSTDGTRLLVREYLSTEHSALYILDVATSQLEPVAPTAHLAVYHEARFWADDRRVYFTSDRGGDFVELDELDLATGDLRSLTRDIKWDVEGIALWSSQIAFATNEDGHSVLRICDAERRIMHRIRGVPSESSPLFASLTAVRSWP